MIYFNPVTKQKGECIAVGRGAIAIQLALQGIKKGDKILVPVNVCYAVVLAIIYSGGEPVFCDVEKKSGNVTIEIIKKKCAAGVVAAIIPHMYGNPVTGFTEIADYLRKKKICIIEDCASLMTNKGENYVPGTIGDYVVYSTGYSKPIDIGFGGLLFSSRKKLGELEKYELQQQHYKSEYGEEWDVFSKLYRVLRNAESHTRLEKTVYEHFPDCLRESFMFSIGKNQKEQILSSVSNIEKMIKERIDNNNVYCSFLEGNDHICIYNFHKDAVPWRFCALTKNDNKEFIKYCLSKGLPVSDWYPRVNKMFLCKQEFPDAEWHENHIVNFPLIKSYEEIKAICKVVNEFER